LILVWSKRTPNMPQDLCRSLGLGLKMPLHIREQQFKRAAVMIMRHNPSGDTPEPLNAVGVWIIGRRIHHV
jgi:hypothetical protein